MKYTGILLALAGPCVFALAIGPAAALEAPEKAAIQNHALAVDHTIDSDSEDGVRSSPFSAVQYMSTCDPEDDLSQVCCDALEQAVQLESAPRLAAAMEVCDPNTDATAADDCAEGECNGAISCKKLKKLCNNIMVQGDWNCTETNAQGTCVGGTCKKCFDE